MVLTLSDHQFACHFLLIGFHPTKITAVLSMKEEREFFPVSTMPGSLAGNQTVTPFAINYPVLHHCFPSVMKPWAILFPLWLTAVMMMPYLQWANTMGRSGNQAYDKQWQERLSTTCNSEELLKQNRQMLRLKAHRMHLRGTCAFPLQSTSGVLTGFLTPI